MNGPRRRLLFLVLPGAVKALVLSGADEAADDELQWEGENLLA